MRSLLPPKPPQVEGRWYVASVVVHVVFLGLLVWVSTHAPAGEREVRLVRLFENPQEPIRAFTMRLGDPVASGVDVGEADRAGTLGRISLSPAVIAAGRVGPRGLASPPESLSIGIPGASSTVPGAIVVGTRRRIGPTFGDGRVWQMPLEVVIDDGGFWGPLETQLAMRVAEMLDSVAVESLMAEGMPRWVFNAAGKEWGIDQQYIHLGPIKIPTMLLGLLPIGGTGNYELAKQAQWLADVRQQILRQSRDQAQLATFKDYVSQLRDRRLRERQEERRRRGLVASRDSTR